MDKKRKKMSIEKRRQFVGKLAGVLPLIAMGVPATGESSMPATTKMLTAEGELVEVDEALYKNAVLRTPTTNEEILKWRKSKGE